MPQERLSEVVNLVEVARDVAGMHGEGLHVQDVGQILYEKGEPVLEEGGRKKSSSDAPIHCPAKSNTPLSFIAVLYKRTKPELFWKQLAMLDLF